jgi:hypothetical protein
MTIAATAISRRRCPLLGLSPNAVLLPALARSTQHARPTLFSPLARAVAFLAMSTRD